MKLTAQALNLDWPEVDRRVCRFIKDYVERSKAKGVVLGLSGGIDSCTIAALSTRALGGHNVLGLLLFEKETRRTEDVRHAELVAKEFGFKTETVDITPTLTVDGWAYDSWVADDDWSPIPLTYYRLRDGI